MDRFDHPRVRRAGLQMLASLVLLCCGTIAALGQVQDLSGKVASTVQGATVQRLQIIEVDIYRLEGSGFAVVVLPSGSVVVPLDLGQAIVDTTVPDASYSWQSGGVTVTKNFYKKPNENEPDFNKRCTEAVTAAKKDFPPDPQHGLAWAPFLWDFPGSLYAHSIVTVKMHVDELPMVSASRSR